MTTELKFICVILALLKAIYKFRTKRYFVKEEEENQESKVKDPFQITFIELCPENCFMLTANISSVVILSRLDTQEKLAEIEVSFGIYLKLFITLISYSTGHRKCLQH